MTKKNSEFKVKIASKMNKIFRNINILIFPFLILVIVNETIRFNKKKEFINGIGLVTINSKEALLNKCTWKCYNSSTYCLENHVKVFKPLLQYINPIYFGIISALKSTGNYVLANLIFLVILWPLLMYILLLSILNIQKKIKLTK